MTVLAQKHVIGDFRADLFARFQLHENPFGVTPNPKYLYESRTHREAKSSLIIGLECGVGFQALIASPGMGKTTIVSHILQRFQPTALTVLLFQVLGGSSDFLRYLLSELGINKPINDLRSAQESINQLLLRQFRDRRPVIVVIDEAQNLSSEVMETLRLLSNFETASEKLLQVIFSGQPQLASKLGHPELAQLRQRISIITTLTPFDRADTEKYIEHRISLAGYRGLRLFTPEAVTMLWKHSQGIPRNINTLCFNALLLAGSAGRQQIDEAGVLEVVKDRNLDLLTLPTIGGQPISKLGLDSSESRIESLELPSSSETISTEGLTHPSHCLHAVPDRSSLLAELRTITREGKLSFRAMLQRISEAAQMLTRANGAAIAIQHGSFVVCQASTGDMAPDLGAKLDMDSGICGQCLRTGGALRCDDINNDARVDVELCRRLGLGSLAVVPVGEKPDVCGVLGVFSRLPEAFRDDQVQLLEELAELVMAVRRFSAQPFPAAARDKVSSAKGESRSKRALIAATAVLGRRLTFKPKP